MNNYNYDDYSDEDVDNLKCYGSLLHQKGLNTVCEDFLAEMITNKTLSVNLFNDLAQKSLGMNIDMINLVEKALGMGLPTSEKDGLYCKSKKCQEKLKMLKVHLQLLYLSKTGKTPGIGTLLKYFTGVEKKENKKNLISFLKATTNFFPVDFECNSKSLGLKHGEIMIHEYLKRVSKLVGFSDQELVSIYDLPGMLTLVHSDKEGKLGPQSYLYSRCQNDINFKLTSLNDCYKWNSYAHGISGIIWLL